MERRESFTKLYASEIASVPKTFCRWAFRATVRVSQQSIELFVNAASFVIDQQSNRI